MLLVASAMVIWNRPHGAADAFSSLHNMVRSTMSLQSLESSQLLVRADANETGYWQSYKWMENPDGSFSLQSHNGLYVTALKSGAVIMHPDVIGDHWGWQSFQNVTNSDGTFALRCFHGKVLTALPKGTVLADGIHIGKWEAFTRVDNDDGTVSLQSAHGKYLSPDLSSPSLLEAAGFQVGRNLELQISVAPKYSVAVMGTAEEVKGWEKFTVVYNNDYTVSLKTYHGTYVTTPKHGPMHADSVHITGPATFKMKETKWATFFQSIYGKFLTAEAYGSVLADADKAFGWQSFKKTDNGDGTVSFKTNHGKYLTAQKVPDKWYLNVKSNLSHSLREPLNHFGNHWCQAGDDVMATRVQAVPSYPQKDVLWSVTTCFSCSEINFQQAVSGVLSVLHWESNENGRGLQRLYKLVVVNEVRFGENETDKDWASVFLAEVPDAQFIQKQGDHQKGQVKSLNLILSMLKSSGAQYWLQWEESWHATGPFIHHVLAIMDTWSLQQVEVADNSWISWPYNKTHLSNNIIWIHRSDKMCNCSSDRMRKLGWNPVKNPWPLFSLRPSMNRADSLPFVGNFSTDPKQWPWNFEFDWGCALLHMRMNKGAITGHSVVTRQPGHKSAAGGQARHA